MRVRRFPRKGADEPGVVHAAFCPCGAAVCICGNECCGSACAETVPLEPPASRRVNRAITKGSKWILMKIGTNSLSCLIRRQAANFFADFPFPENRVSIPIQEMLTCFLFCFAILFSVQHRSSPLGRPPVCLVGKPNMYAGRNCGFFKQPTLEKGGDFCARSISYRRRIQLRYCPASFQEAG